MLLKVVYAGSTSGCLFEYGACVVLDVANPSAPREVSRLETPEDFNPHWLARDPSSNRLVLGADLGGEEGFDILRFDEQRGTIDDVSAKALPQEGKFMQQEL